MQAMKCAKCSSGNFFHNKNPLRTDGRKEVASFGTKKTEPQEEQKAFAKNVHFSHLSFHS